MGFINMLKCVLMQLNFKLMEFENTTQKLYDKLHKVIYQELSKMELPYIKQGDSYIIGESQFKGKKITIKITVK